MNWLSHILSCCAPAPQPKVHVIAANGRAFSGRVVSATDETVIIKLDGDGGRTYAAKSDGSFGDAHIPGCSLLSETSLPIRLQKWLPYSPP